MVLAEPSPGLMPPKTTSANLGVVQPNSWRLSFFETRKLHKCSFFAVDCVLLQWRVGVGGIAAIGITIRRRTTEEKPPGTRARRLPISGDVRIRAFQDEPARPEQSPGPVHFRKPVARNYARETGHRTIM